jgi:Na+-translocating ferredoxin:NAD+ oxidoreductase subunit B
MPSPPKEPFSRRQFLRDGTRIAAFTGLGGLLGLMASRSASKGTVWQIDPDRCLRCDRCATHCVLEQSAVKCVHTYAICGYCQLCTGYFEPQPNDLNTGAENQLCPTAAIKRTFIEDPYYEYSIDEELCIGCAKCVEGCTRFGNGSLFLQVRHDRCVNCNECAIAKVCPGDAFVRVPADEPYLLKTTH